MHVTYVIDFDKIHKYCLRFNFETLNMVQLRHIMGRPSRQDSHNSLFENYYTTPHHITVGLRSSHINFVFFMILIIK